MKIIGDKLTMTYKCKCGCTDMFTEKKGTNTGLYCSKCGRFQKWLGKNELRAFEYNMREATKEEQKEIQDNIDKISKSTGNNFYDKNTIVDRLNEFIDFLDKEMDRQLTRKSLSSMDEISKCSYAHAYGKVKTSLINIVDGRRYNEYEMQ